MTEEQLVAFKFYPKSKLIAFISGDIPTSPNHIAARYELDRRAGAFGRRLAIAAFVVSVVLLIISLLGYIASHQPRRVETATESVQPR